MVKFAKPEESYEIGKKMTANAENILQKLNLIPCRCSLYNGDMVLSYEDLRLGSVDSRTQKYS